jgi:hypothetical protein
MNRQKLSRLLIQINYDKSRKLGAVKKLLQRDHKTVNCGNDLNALSLSNNAQQTSVCVWWFRVKEKEAGIVT